MPDEPNMSIESQVRAYAETRRKAAGEPLEMHPATRHMLQAEVARTLSAQRPARQRSLWPALWMRLLWAGGAGALATWALLVVVDRNPGEARQLAMQRTGTATSAVEHPAADMAMDRHAAAPEKLRDQSSAAFAATPDQSESADAMIAPAAAVPAASRTAVRGEPSAPPAPPAAQSAPLPAATPVVSAEAASALGEGRRMLLNRDENSRAIVPSEKVARQGPATGGTSPGFLEERQDKAMEARRKTDPAPAANPALSLRPSGAVAATAANTAGQLSVRMQNGVANAQQGGSSTTFQQVTPMDAFRRNINSPPMPRVLQQFEFQQAGNVVRIVDSDGSVYVGHVTNQLQGVAVTGFSGNASGALAENLQRKLPEAELNQNITRNAPAGEEDVYFAVTGTNQSLNQRVYFSGRVQGVLGTNADSNAFPGQTQKRAGQGGTPALKIEGRASVGQRNEVPVEAVPAKP